MQSASSSSFAAGQDTRARTVKMKHLGEDWDKTYPHALRPQDACFRPVRQRRNIIDSDCRYAPCMEDDTVQEGISDTGYQRACVFRRWSVLNGLGHQRTGNLSWILTYPRVFRPEWPRHDHGYCGACIHQDATAHPRHRVSRRVKWR
jgi:hypothetical protein